MDSAHSRVTNGVRVVAAAICNHDRWLICRRPTHKRHGGLWEFPGGKCEFGESDVDAIVRELSEELDVVARTAGIALFSVADPGSEFVIVFIETNIEGTPRAIEHSEIAWATLEQLASMQLAPSDLRFVQFLKDKQ